MPRSDDMANRLAELFKALADPTRVRIIAKLADAELCVHELADDLDLEQSLRLLGL